MEIVDERPVPGLQLLFEHMIFVKSLSMENTGMPHTAKCIVCGKEFVGRPDKKYCSRKCKNAHNNKIHGTMLKYRRSAINALDGNYAILSSVLALGASGAKLEDICAMGFSPEAVCSHRKGKNGHNEYTCYDLIYNQTGLKIFNLHRVDSIREKSPSAPHGKR